MRTAPKLAQAILDLARQGDVRISRKEVAAGRVTPHGASFKCDVVCIGVVVDKGSHYFYREVIIDRVDKGSHYFYREVIIDRVLVDAQPEVEASQLAEALVECSAQMVEVPLPSAQWRRA